MRYYTDGSSTIGVKSAHCVTDDKGKVVIFEESILNQFTSNEEEYRGVIAALNICNDGDEIFTDSQLVVNQINGLYRVKKPHLLGLCNEAKTLSDKKHVSINWIGRDNNLAGKILEK